MAALIVGLFAPVGLTAFAVGMDRFQRRMESHGSRRRSSLHIASSADAAVPPPRHLSVAVPGVPTVS